MRRLFGQRAPYIEIIGSFLVGLGLLFFVFFLMNIIRPSKTPVGVVTVMFDVIYAPTETPVHPTPMPVTPTVVLDIPPPANGIAVSGYVQISGTGGDGLRIRGGPGLDHDPLFVGLESEVFHVIDGPHEADGYVWWHLAAPYDENINGWAVSNYLAFVEAP